MVQVIDTIALVVGGIGVAVILLGVVLILLKLPKVELQALNDFEKFRHREALRHNLGSYLLMGLEFMIAADIIKTLAHPTLTDLGFLAAIVGIRTVISYFLEREVEQFHKNGETLEG